MPQSPKSKNVVVLAGGTGGAKLARAFYEVIGNNLTVIANTGDDLEIYGAYVSPDPDLITFWLAGEIDQRGWGLRDDTFQVMAGLRKLGRDVWFNLGDADLAIGLERQRRLNSGEKLTVAQKAINKSFDVTANVLPMCDTPVRTHIKTGGTWWPFQDFMIRNEAKGPIEDVRFHSVEKAAVSPTTRMALETADLIVIGPSNPIISIDPILAVPGMRTALALANVPIIAVSPIVGGNVIKGPTDEFLRWAGVQTSNAGVCVYYGDLLDGFVADSPCDPTPTCVTDVQLDTPEERRTVINQILSFAQEM